MITGRAGRVGGVNFLNLRCSVLLGGADGEGMLPCLEGPLIAPNHPCCLGERRTQLRRLPRAAIDTYLYLGDTTISSPGDATKRHPLCIAVVDNIIDGDGINDRGGLDLGGLI